MLPDDKDQLGERLSAYLDGALGEADAAEVERLIAADPHARDMFDALRRTVETVRALPRRPAPDGLLDDVTARIERAELLGADTEPGPPIRGRPRSPWRLLASAAILVFAVGGGMWTFHRMSESISPPDQQLALAEKDEPRWRADELEDRTGPAPGARGGEKIAVLRDRVSKAEEVADAYAESKLGEVHRAGADQGRRRAHAEPTGRYAEALGRTAGTEPPQVEAGLIARDRKKEAEAAVLPEPTVVTQAAAPYDPDDSLAVKLRRGIKWSDVLNHRFANESNQLDVSFPTVRARDGAQRRINAFMMSNRVQSLERAAVDDATPIGPAATFFVEGRSHRNFGETPDDRQVLVRLRAAQVAALVEEVGAAAGGRVQLHIGGFVVASDPNRAREILGSPTADRRGTLAKRAEGPLASAARSAYEIDLRRARGPAPVGRSEAAEGEVAARKSGRLPPVAPPAGAEAEAARDADAGEPADALPIEDGTTRPHVLPEPDRGPASGPDADAADEVITVVINLRVPPTAARDDGPLGPPRTPPAAVPSATQPSTKSELAEDP